MKYLYLGLKQISYMIAQHYRADITALTIPRGDTTASDFTARYIYSARHYRAF
jgi:hypothetical protein